MFEITSYILNENLKLSFFSGFLLPGYKAVFETPEANVIKLKPLCNNIRRFKMYFKFF